MNTRSAPPTFSCRNSFPPCWCCCLRLFASPVGRSPTAHGGLVTLHRPCTNRLAPPVARNVLLHHGTLALYARPRRRTDCQALLHHGLVLLSLGCAGGHPRVALLGRVAEVCEELRVHAEERGFAEVTPRPSFAAGLARLLPEHAGLDQGPFCPPQARRPPCQKDPLGAFQCAV